AISGANVTAILEDGQGNFWVGTETAGVNLMDRAKGTFQHFANDPFVPSSLSHDSVEAIHQDKSGAIWLGTYNGGVSYFYEPKFEQFGLGPGSAGLANSVVTSLIEDRHGEIWIGTDGGGLARLDRDHGTFRHYRHADDDPGSLSNDAVMGLLEDRQGNIWIGTYAGGINLFDRGSESFRHFRHDERDPASLIRDDVRSFYEDAAGNLWVGTGLAGVDLMDRRTGTFSHHQHDPADPNSISGDYAQAVFADHEGILWFGTTLAGLDRFDPHSGRMTHFRHRAADPTSLGGDHVVTIFEDARRRLWVGTTEGLDLADRQPGTFRHYRVKDGLPNDVVNAILEDGGVLWLSTDHGLSRFDPEAGTFRNYDALDGLQGNQFSPQAALRSRRGELYFGGVNGFNVFDPKALHDNAFVPPVVLTELTLNNQPVPIRSQGPLREAISETRSLVLSHRDSVIGFAFAALSYVGARKNRYAYRLEGFDDEWQQVGTRRTATYTNLDPGRYVFRVKAANNDGLWNELGTAVRLVVTPPWWQTWWFRGGTGLLLVLLAGLAFQLRVHTMQRRNAELRNHNLELNEKIEDRVRAEEALRWSEQQVRRLNEELEARVRSRTVQLEAANEELEAFAYSVSHDLRAPLRHIAGFSEMLVDDYGAAIGEVGRDFVDRILASARHMSTLIDGLLLLSRVTRGDMQTARVDLSAVAHRVAETCRQSYPATAVAIAPGLVTRGDGRLLEVALENLLGNAFKFSARVAAPRVELGEAGP
ncbi:MAG TPA: two-component regulator propeller domain-containing protein, partial [Thermoanaerobaculia bacterium]|nr:two-component regulator propeller domain-containing protein [Thermoanaerobaculia bacterium]